MSHTTDPKMQACIDACDRCHQACLHEAMNQCLESGGKHVTPEHMRLMLNCAEICQTSINFMLSSSRSAIKSVESALRCARSARRVASS
jgi:hypothetical protein